MVKPDQLVKYRGMIRVEAEYTKSGLSDSAFAASMSTEDVKYSTAQVREWCRVLGIANNVGTSEPEVKRLKDLLVQAFNYIADVEAADHPLIVSIELALGDFSKGQK